MTEPVRVITQTESWAAEVQQSVVEELELLLDKARSGQLQGFAYSAFLIDNSIATGYTKSTGHSAIIGGLARVQHRMLSAE